jgi:hypothetical protein
MPHPLLAWSDVFSFFFVALLRYVTPLIRTEITLIFLAGRPLRTRRDTADNSTSFRPSPTIEARETISLAVDI